MTFSLPLRHTGQIIAARCGIRPIGACLLLLLAAADSRTAEDTLSAADVPRKFEGTFVWRHNKDEFKATLTLAEVIDKEGSIHFRGQHHYQPGNHHIHVRGTIDPRTRRVKMTEYDPNRPEPDADVDGQFTGGLAKNLQSLEAVWIGNNGNKGDLKLKVVNDEDGETTDGAHTPRLRE